MKQLIILSSFLLCSLNPAGLSQNDMKDVTGTWKLDVELAGSGGTPTFMLKQEDGNIKGTYQGNFGKAEITGTINGDQIEFSFTISSGEKVTYKGTVDGDEMKGTCEYGSYESGTFTGKREVGKKKSE